MLHALDSINVASHIIDEASSSCAIAALVVHLVCFTIIDGLKLIHTLQFKCCRRFCRGYRDAERVIIISNSFTIIIFR